MTKASREKGKRRERAIANWLSKVMGWKAWRTAMQSSLRGDAPDVVADSPIGALFVEVKDDAKIPGKAMIDAWKQAAGYCKSGQTPVLVMHLQGTSNDLVVMEKSTLAMIVEEASGRSSRD